ncbi:MAG: ABC transporter permease [Chloroflexota bacterium]|nr:MAG: ABC transporter permease [Chloroflexota bacterium]
MKHIWLVLRHEVISTVTRRSFQLTAFGLPLISIIFFTVLSLFSRSLPGTISGIINPAEQDLPIPEGFVDLSGLIDSMPENIAQEALLAFHDETAAKSALQSGEISAYYLIPEDYLARGEVTFVSRDFNPMDAFNGGTLIDRVLQFNLLEGDSRLLNIVRDPFALQVMILNPGSSYDQDSTLAFLVPYMVMLLYYMLILMSAGFLVSSLNKERENDILEILLVSLTPRQLLAGKFIGLGLMGLLVNILWVGSAYGLFFLSGSRFQVPPQFQLAPQILVWGVVYFLLGYAIYASLLGAFGALLPNLRETSQATMVVILPMIIPLMFISILIAQPNGLLAVSLSLFPLTAPVTMMLRLAVTIVPVWQLVLSVCLLLSAAVFTLRAVSRMFHAQMMLSGQPMSLRNIYRMIIGRV